MKPSASYVQELAQSAGGVKPEIISVMVSVKRDAMTMVSTKAEYLKSQIVNKQPQDWSKNKGKYGSRVRLGKRDKVRLVATHGAPKPASRSTSTMFEGRQARMA